MDAFDGCPLDFPKPPEVRAMILLILTILVEPKNEIYLFLLRLERKDILLDVEPWNEVRGIDGKAIAVLVEGVGTHPFIVKLILTPIRGRLSHDEGVRSRNIDRRDCGIDNLLWSPLCSVREKGFLGDVSHSCIGRTAGLRVASRTSLYLAGARDEVLDIVLSA